jgi:hypothetical protein
MLAAKRLMFSLKKNKDCALLHSSGPMRLMFSLAGMANSGTGIADRSDEQL